MNTPQLTEITLTNKPLCEFIPGQRLTVKFNISPGHYAFCPAEFVAIENGRVKAKLLDGWEPLWYDWRMLENKYPNRIGTFLAKNCLLWGISSGITWPRCHWFKNTKIPVI